VSKTCDSRHTHAHTRTRKHTHTRKHKHARAHTHANTHTHNTHANTHAHTHTYTHTRTHAQIHIGKQNPYRDVALATARIRDQHHGILFPENCKVNGPLLLKRSIFVQNEMIQTKEHGNSLLFLRNNKLELLCFFLKQASSPTVHCTAHLYTAQPNCTLQSLDASFY